jgi:putative transport protein
MLVALTPMLTGYVVARFVFGMNLLQIVGGVCGGMTSTPALGVITGAVDSEVPVISYAAAYPVALILTTVLGKILVVALG